MKQCTMKTLMTMTLTCAVLALPSPARAWVAAGPGRRPPPPHGRPPAYHGGYNCGGVSTGTAVAAGIAGLAVGAAIAKNNQPTVVVAPAPVYVTPVYVTPPPPVVVVPTAAVGSIFTTLPAGAKSVSINGTQYYVLGTTCFRPFFGNNGVYYQVVPNPI
jgi:hypothetical protein